MRSIYEQLLLRVEHNTRCIRRRSKEGNSFYYSPEKRGVRRREKEREERKRRDRGKRKIDRRAARIKYIIVCVSVSISIKINYYIFRGIAPDFSLCPSVRSISRTRCLCARRTQNLGHHVCALSQRVLRGDPHSVRASATELSNIMRM